MKQTSKLRIIRECSLCRGPMTEDPGYADSPMVITVRSPSNRKLTKYICGRCSAFVRLAMFGELTNDDYGSKPAQFLETK